MTFRILQIVWLKVYDRPARSNTIRPGNKGHYSCFLSLICVIFRNRIKLRYIHLSARNILMTTVRPVVFQLSKIFIYYFVSKFKYMAFMLQTTVQIIFIINIASLSRLFSELKNLCIEIKCLNYIFLICIFLKVF